MKTNQLLDLLKLQGQSFAQAGGTDELSAVAIALEPFRGKTLSAFVKQISKSAPGYASMQQRDAGLGGALTQLASLRAVLSAAAAKSAVKDMDTLQAALTPVMHLSADQLAVALQSPPLCTKPASSKPKPKTVDQNLVREVADKLTAANYDDHVFKSLLLEIRARKLDKATVNAIANEFLGRDRNSKDQTVAKAFEAIEARHQLDSLSESRARKIESVNM